MTKRRGEKRRRWPARIGLMIFGLAIGMLVTEGVFSRRDEGAFPHLNAYLADDALGVRLEPGATGKVRVGKGPVTSFRINSRGFRGAEWPPAGEDQLIVVGDSQAFGLGVQESETFAARLAEKLQRPVLNAGVPTYGPPEYHAMVERLLAERKGATVVYLVNIGNDLFEAHRPNRERHAVWDSWAVRKETAPLETTSFPGRAWLFRRSHLVFAWRKLYYDKRYPKLEDAAFPSEGGWQDLVRLGGASRNKREAHRRKEVAEAAFRPTELAYLERSFLRSQLDVEELLYEEVVGNDPGTSLLLRSARATPGDIVAVGPGEAGAPLGATALSIRQGVARRAELEQKLRALADETADEAKKKRIGDSLEARAKLAEDLAKLRAAPLLMTRAMSPLAEPLTKLKALCDQHGAKLVVVALPLDVQVSADEWAKYGQEPIDMAGTEVLLQDVLALAESLGVRALDLTAPLKAAQPGAFLGSDLHLSPKGHEVVAEALVAKLKESAPMVRLPGLPIGRSRRPRLSDWRSRSELIVIGSDAAGCETRMISEWMLVRCTQRASAQHRASGRWSPYQHGTLPGPMPLGARLIEGDTSEVEITAFAGTVTLVAPIFPGSKLVVDFFWLDRRRRLTVDWPKDEPVANAIELVNQPDLGTVPKPLDREAFEQLCSCQKKVSGDDHCWQLLGGPNDDCARSYGDDCQALLGCVAGDPLYPPTCAPGKLNGFAAERCFEPCGACEGGTCRDWQGVSLCVR